MLNQPVDELFSKKRKVLLAGAGGGYDLISGLGIAFALRAAGHEVHLANLTFTSIEGLEGARKLSHDLICVDERTTSMLPYAPEVHLSHWFAEREEPTPVYLLRKTGVVPCLRSYQLLIAETKADTVILVDGGIDALLRGDEISLGTPAEDAVSLLAVNQLPEVTKILSCIGFGAERWDGISHGQVFKRISEYMAGGALLGVEALLPQTRVAILWQEALKAIHEKSAGQHRGTIAAAIKAAIDGDFGLCEVSPKGGGRPIWISPLTNLVWHFDLDKVADARLYKRDLMDTQTMGDVCRIIDGLHQFFQTDPEPIEIDSPAVLKATQHRDGK